MRERCLMPRPHMQTSSPPAGRGAGTPCTTSCRAPATLRGASCPSASPCRSCTSTREAEMETIPRTARTPLPRPTETPCRGTANLLEQRRRSDPPGSRWVCWLEPPCPRK